MAFFTKRLNQTTLLLWLSAASVVVYSCVNMHQGPGVNSRARPQKVLPTTDKAPLAERQQRGFLYITEGNYHGTGIPMTPLFIRKIQGRNTVKGLLPDSLLTEKRTISSKVPFGYSAVLATNNTAIINANCFSCHAGHVDKKFVLGLGNTNSIYQKDYRLQSQVLDKVVKTMYGPRSSQRGAYGHFGDYFKAVAKTTITPNPVVNPAFRLEEACVRHRNPVDFSYSALGLFEMVAPVYASDVPPLWNVRKKSTLYYNGMGQGDKTKLLMQITAMGITDTTMARSVQQNFLNVVAWINSLQPPPYPGRVDQQSALQGKALFLTKCSKCHGTYGESGVYPNRVVALDVVKTDPLYAQYFVKQSGLPNWYNSSWFAHSYPASALRPTMGYQAPPLDGIWATAPYLHNGSIPTLKALLNSKIRPLYWTYSAAYTYQAVGIGNTETLKQPVSKRNPTVYNTTVPGYGKDGHYFSDECSDSQRADLLEYLKTL